MNINTKNKIRDGLVRFRAKLITPFYKAAKFIRNQVPQLILTSFVATGSMVAVLIGGEPITSIKEAIVRGLLGWLYVGYRYFNGP